MRKDFQGRRDSPSARPCELVQRAGSPGMSGPQGSCVADPRERSVSTQPCLLSKPLCPKWDIRSSHLLWPLPPLLPPGDRDKAAQVWKRPQKRPHTFPFQAEEKAALSHSSACPDQAGQRPSPVPRAKEAASDVPATSPAPVSVLCPQLLEAAS